jgi:stage V sporulation protein R
MKGNEVTYASVNAKVTAMPRVGLNPYALGMRLFSFIEETADKGRFSFDFKRLKDVNERERFNRQTGAGTDFIFSVRENMNDFMFINAFVDQAFVDRHKLFVSERRANKERGVWEYSVKSRKAESYRQMLLDSLYHPPCLVISEEKSKDGCLYLDHRFEGKPLVQEFIAGTMMGVEYLWGGPVRLETTEWVAEPEPAYDPLNLFSYMLRKSTAQVKRKKHLERVVYTMEKRQLTRSTVT